jgi:hypothetical protein
LSATLDIFRVRPLPVGSGIRVSEELGVGRGVPEGVRLGLGVEPGSVDIGGKEGEYTETGLFDGRRCTFL